ncbi:MAG: putative toxin-antitoxin system toxin component, PIN family [Pseudomonadota bacterium]|nr:putative toxin-antitoxin system toxin component, PIN family [Pseudomonadota bacterium]
MSAARGHALPRVVLDTNAWLDLLLFEDPRIARLGDALRAGIVQAVISPGCRSEWLRVLDYPQLRLPPAQREGLSARLDALAVCIDPPDVTPVRVSSAAHTPRLPRCADPDDQVFLQLALDSGARWLVSRDRAVLALGRRTLRAGWFEIVEPWGWSLAEPPGTP